VIFVRLNGLFFVGFLLDLVEQKKDELLAVMLLRRIKFEVDFLLEFDIVVNPRIRTKAHAVHKFAYHITK
jgi:hypothetical protein